MESEPQASSGGRQRWWLLCDFSFGWVLQVPSCAWPRSIPLEQICPCMQVLGMWARATPGVWFLHPCILPLKLMLPFAARSLAGCSSPGWGWEQVLGDLELGSWVRWAVPPGPAYQSNTNRVLRQEPDCIKNVKINEILLGNLLLCEHPQLFKGYKLLCSQIYIFYIYKYIYLYEPCIYVHIHVPNTWITEIIYTNCWALRRLLAVTGTGGACCHAGFMVLINNEHW